METNCEILQIESDSEQVRIDFRFCNMHGHGGWVRINGECFIRPTGSDLILKMIRAEGIPIAPKSLEFKADGDVLFYSLYFPPLPEGVSHIDILEDPDDEEAINFYEIPIQPLHHTMNTHTPSILQTIEQIALEFKGSRNTPKKFRDELSRLESQLLALSKTISLPTEELAIFCLALYTSVTSESFCLTELKNYCHFSPFDYHSIKLVIQSLHKKGWLVKEGQVGYHRGPRRLEERVFSIPESVMNALHKNEEPVIHRKEPDVYLTSDLLYKCLREFVDYDTTKDELAVALHEMELEYAEIQPFKTAIDLNLNDNERLILYYAVSKTSTGEEVVEVDRMLFSFFKRNQDRVWVKKMLATQQGKLFDAKLIELVKEDFRTDKQFKLTAVGVKQIFGEDACFLSNDDDFSAGLCKLIKHESIVERELFYNDSEKSSIATILEFLKGERYADVVKRLEEHKMKPGMTILLHGYPGTGKTETIYQLARQTQRNILLVDISAIRDKWVGESEKRLKAVFETYRNSVKHFDQVPILLFNESDALIGKRIHVNSSVDQMNNAMQNILLQELEDFTGILMATTNLTSNLDEAFERRFLFKIKYSKPGLEAKSAIWKSKLSFLTSEEASELATKYDLSGGQIENISRKVFLDSVLHGAACTLEQTLHCCEAELLKDNRRTRKIGF